MTRFTRKDFLDALFQDYFREREGFVMVKSSRPPDQRTSIRYFPNTEILAKEPYQVDQHVFFGVCPHEKMRAEKSHIRYLVALWAGLDLDPEGYSGKQTHFFSQAQAAKAIRSFPLPPSIIVESGRGVHLYWLLKEVTPVTDVESAESLLGRINSYFQCKAGIGVDSMLRLPDTSNGKLSAVPAKCRIKYLNPDFRYDLAEFEQLSLGVAASVTEASGGKRLTKGISRETAAQAEAAVDAAGSVEAAGGITEAVETQIDSGKTPEAAGRKRPALSIAEPDFVAAPYEAAGKKPDAFLQPQSAEAIRADVLDAMADKLADKISERIATKLVDQIVDKIVERIKAPR